MRTKELLAVCLLALLHGCSASQPEPEPKSRPEQAGQPMGPAKTAGRIAAIRGAAVLGDQEAVRANMSAMQEDFRKSIKLADPARRVDRESARAAARQVPGVRSVAWLDRENLLAIVAANELRSYETIDAICMALEPLGDTLGVVVNLQSGAATTGDDLEILSRNCQLAPGDRAFLQRNRQVDVIAPSIRAQHKASKTAAEAAARDREAEAAESLRILEASTPEM
jgi:hypothetical protein